MSGLNGETVCTCVCVVLRSLQILIEFISKFSSTLRSVDVSAESKQFQELLLERTKALAAQTEALKSSNSDGKCDFNALNTIFEHVNLNSLLIPN